MHCIGAGGWLVGYYHGDLLYSTDDELAVVIECLGVFCRALPFVETGQE